jgi:hypothetical protein
LTRASSCWGCCAHGAMSIRGAGKRCGGCRGMCVRRAMLNARVNDARRSGRHNQNDGAGVVWMGWKPRAI